MTNVLSASQLNELHAQLWSHKSHNGNTDVLAILDGARHTCIEPMINNSGLEHHCLYRDVKQYALKRAAPHIVRLERHHAFTQKLLQQGWGQSWGMFITADPAIPLSRFRYQFRLIAKAKLPDGSITTFRYYDPRVLRVLLPTCDAHQTKQLFGHAQSLCMENAHANALLRFTAENDETKVAVNTYPLETASALNKY